MPGGLTWGLGNKDAALPSGWRYDLDFYKYGGPGTSYSGGRLPPRIKDIIVHYFYLLGINPNYHARTVPEGYEERDLDNLAFILPPPDFANTAWTDPKDPDNDSEASRVYTHKTHRKTLSRVSPSPQSGPET